MKFSKRTHHLTAHFTKATTKYYRPNQTFLQYCNRFRSTATVTAKPPIDHRTPVSVTTNSDSAPLIFRRPLPLDTSLERQNFDLEEALKIHNVTTFLSELAPPGEEVKNIIDHLEKH